MTANACPCDHSELDPCDPFVGIDAPTYYVTIGDIEPIEMTVEYKDGAWRGEVVLPDRVVELVEAEKRLTPARDRVD